MGEWGALGGEYHCDVRKILCKSPLVPACAPGKGQGILRPSSPQAQGPVTVKRRSAAQPQGCAHAHTESHAYAVSSSPTDADHNQKQQQTFPTNSTSSCWLRGEEGLQRALGLSRSHCSSRITRRGCSRRLRVEDTLAAEAAAPKGGLVARGCDSGSGTTGMMVPNRPKKVGFGKQGKVTELDRTFDVTLSYTKSYVNPPLSSLRTLKKEQGNEV